MTQKTRTPKLNQMQQGRHANRKFKHVCQFLGPVMDLHVHYWDCKRKPAVLPWLMEANYIWIRNNRWDKEGVCAHLCLFVFAIERQRKMEIRNYMNWNRVRGVHVGNMISAHWENTISWLQRKNSVLLRKWKSPKLVTEQLHRKLHKVPMILLKTEPSASL